MKLEKSSEGEETKHKEKEKAKETEELAGGHKESFRFLPDGTLLKAGKKGELEFFGEFSQPNSPFYTELVLLKPYMPEFYGIVNLGGHKWIKMRNVNHGLTHVSYMDLKMGDKSYSPDDPPDKVQNQIQRAKESTSMEYGFRVTGVMIRDEKGAILYKLHKQFGEIGIEEFPGLVKKFLECNGRGSANQNAAKFYLKRMGELLTLFETKFTRYLIASSLFFVLSNTDNMYDLRVIDFAHVFPLEPGKRDEGFIKGLRSLTKIFNSVIHNEGASS